MSPRYDQAEAAALTSVAPDQGLATGGQTITITGSGFTYTASDYIQSGLVAHFDGIDNTGEGDVAHNSAATTWKNLKSTGDLTLYNGQTWLNNGYQFNSEAVAANQDYFLSSGALNAAIPAGNDDRTLEYAFVTPNYEPDVAVAAALAGYQTNPSAANGTGSLFYPTFRPYGGTSTTINGLSTGYDYVINNPDSFNTPSTFHSVSTPYHLSQLNAATKSFVNGTNYPSVQTTWDNGLRTCGDYPFTAVNRATCAMILGDRVLHDRHANDYTLMSYRIYNRTLTDMEVAQNLRVDQCRFDGASNPDCLPTVSVGGNTCTNVKVISDTQLTCTTPVYGGALNSGTTTAGVDYKVVDVSVTARGVTTALPQSFTYYGPISISSDQGFRSGGQTVTIGGVGFSYKTGDYVQAGLVAHFDGIDNTGAGDAAHSSNATTWKNLKGTGDVTLHNGHTWLANGYRFNSEAAVANQDYFASSGALNAAIPVTNADRTLEYTFMSPNSILAEKANYLAGYMPNDVAAGISSGSQGGSAMLQVRSGSTVNSQSIAINGFSHPYDYNIITPTSFYVVNSFNSVSTPYHASQLDASTKVFVNGASYPSTLTDNGGLFTCWDRTHTTLDRLNCGIVFGNRTTYDTLGNLVPGTHANDYMLMGYRVYNRTLSDTEVARNLRVDQCRFDASNNSDCVAVTIGGQSCTNVSVISDEELTCTIPAWNGTLDSGTTAAGVDYKTVDVTVTANGTTQTLTNGYTYYDEYLTLDLLDSAVSINVAPSTPEASNDTVVTAATNNPSGYALYMVGGSSNAGVVTPDNRLAYQGSPVSYLNSIAGAGVLSDNTWGYQFAVNQPAVGDTNWQPVPNQLGGGFGALVQTTSSAPIVGQVDDYGVWFGARINGITAAGEYRGSVIWTLVANP